MKVNKSIENQKSRWIMKFLRILVLGLKKKTWNILFSSIKIGIAWHQDLKGGTIIFNLGWGKSSRKCPYFLVPEIPSNAVVIIKNSWISWKTYQKSLRFSKRTSKMKSILKKWNRATLYPLKLNFPFPISQTKKNLQKFK